MNQYKVWQACAKIIMDKCLKEWFDSHSGVRESTESEVQTQDCTVETVNSNIETAALTSENSNIETTPEKPSIRSLKQESQAGKRMVIRRRLQPRKSRPASRRRRMVNGGKSKVQRRRATPKQRQRKSGKTIRKRKPVVHKRRQRMTEYI